VPRYLTFEFNERTELFVRVHNKAPSVAALCLNNPDRSPLAINGGHPAHAPTGFAKSVSDDFPVLQAHLNAVYVF